MSKVTINQANINRFFESRLRSGSGRGARGGGVERVAARMVAAVIAEAKKDFRTSGGPGRTGDLIKSFRPIIKPDPRGGFQVGVGSTLKYADYLTNGTPAHDIRPRGKYRLKSAKGHPDPLKRPTLLARHPGTKPNDFIRRGVNLAIGRPLP